MALLYSASNILTSPPAVSGINELLPDGLRFRNNPKLFEGSAGKRTTSFRVSKRSVCLLQQNRPKPRVILIAGPPGVGKTRVSIELAKVVDGEIINADMELVYQSQNPGVDNTPQEEQNAIPHHLKGVVPPTRDYTKMEFLRATRTATEDILGKGKVPIVVGGTGMAMRTYMHNRADLSSQPEEGEFDARSWDYDFQGYFMYQHRADLYPHVDLRCEQMVPALLASAAWLLSQGVKPNNDGAARTIGCEEAMALLLHARKNRGHVSDQQLVSFLHRFQANVKELVRKEFEWFRCESRSEVQQFKWLAAPRSEGQEYKWLAAQDSPLKRVVKCLAEQYHSVGSRVSMGQDLRNSSVELLEERRLREYVPALSVYSDPEAVAATLDWIKFSQAYLDS